MKTILKSLATDALIVLVTFLVVIAIFWIGFPWEEANAQDESDIKFFDTSALENWCGDPIGTIRMVGAGTYNKDTFEDEVGNLWRWDEIDENGFYLLWIDDMGTPEMEDDEIVKVWREEG